jgi:hypothetical protein
MRLTPAGPLSFLQSPPRGFPGARDYRSEPLDPDELAMLRAWLVC